MEPKWAGEGALGDELDPETNLANALKLTTNGR